MTYSSPLLSAFNFFEKSRECGVSFDYRGPFMDDLTCKILDISENTIADNQELSKVSRKVSFLMVECFQNIVRHGEETPEELSSTLKNGLFSFKNIGNSFIINSINLVDIDEINDITGQVEFINSLNSEQLREVCRTKLQHNKISGKGGAGLGLLELARKSGQKIKYKFEKVNDKVSLFHQQISFVKKGFDEEIDHIEFCDGTLHKMQEDKLLLQYKGDFSQRSILPLLKIVENSMGGNEAEIQKMKKLGKLLIEILLNISKHGEECDGSREGVFLIGFENGKVFIEAGNPILTDKLEKFQGLLDDALSQSDEEISNKIEGTLLDSLQNNSECSGGIGLLEIVKSTSKPLHYNFNRTTDGKLFFSLRATV